MEKTALWTCLEGIPELAKDVFDKVEVWDLALLEEKVDWGLE